jgi:hypothetical protein
MKPRAAAAAWLMALAAAPALALAAADPVPGPDNGAAAGAPPTPAGAEPAPSPPPLEPIPEPRPPMAPPPMAPPPMAPPRRRLYGDAGSMELALALGYTQQSGFLGGGGFRRFVSDGVGPGLEASVQKSDGLTAGLLLASLKLVPLRGDSAALVITGRGGRILLSDHDDGWGAGLGGGVILFFSSGIGLELGYSILWLRPARFCADLPSCTIEGPELGLRVMF